LHLFTAAFQAFEHQQYQESRRLYEQLLSKYPSDSTSHYNLALLLERHYSDFIGAKFHYEQAIRSYPDYTNAKFAVIGLLMAHFSVYAPGPPPGQPPQKIEAINLDASDALTGSADDSAKRKNYIRAKADYEMALRLYPGNARAYNNFAVLLSNHYADYSTARTYYETALRLDPKFTLARTNLNNLLAKRFRKNWWDDFFG